ncbi:hypothetical protein L210DRAFT_3499623 [Boletus edulis BED1]|uniref:Uncharacterized protein n=1 Tax=Boletus edulis BED1 TaxID=1328754 RepID=A0AAD4C9V7_BOLED|nr:hypothetical protein L210DRAFT_3499623 [Boletus edulis BED1]
MNKLETGPGGQRVVQGANRDVKCKTKHGSDTDCIHMIRRGDGKGTATSAVHCDSKRVETGTLAIYQVMYASDVSGPDAGELEMHSSRGSGVHDNGFENSGQRCHHTTPQIHERLCYCVAKAMNMADGVPSGVAGRTTNQTIEKTWDVAIICLTLGIHIDQLVQF